MTSDRAALIGAVTGLVLAPFINVAIYWAFPGSRPWLRIASGQAPVASALVVPR